MASLSLAALALVLTAVLVSGADVQPRTVSFGQSVNLCVAADETPIYFVGVAQLRPGECRSVPLQRTTSFVAIKEAGASVHVESFTATVEGARGSEECIFPSEKFRPVVNGVITVHSFVKLWQGIHDLLQNGMHYNGVYQTPLKDNRVSIVTQCVERDYLLASDDRGIRARRVAVAVEIQVADHTPATAAYAIKAVVQYRRRAEQQWRDEGNLDFYRDEADRVRDRLAALRF